MSKIDLPDSIQNSQGIEKLLAVVAALRHPQTGCPWDLKQTHASLRPYMLEEAYESVAVMDDPALDKDLCEELGDVLLQVALHAQIAEDEGRFDFSKVSEGIAEKLIRRHPHVFGTVSVDNAEQVTQNWEAIKLAEKQAAQKASQKEGTMLQESILASVPAGQPALSRAFETSQKAVKVGFEWPDFNSLWMCVQSEYSELAEVITAQKLSERSADQLSVSQLTFSEPDLSSLDLDRLEDELGDIFFASVNLARYLKIHPEVALSKATDKFTRRFQAMEALIQERYPDISLQEAMARLDFQTWDDLWCEAKKKTGSC